MSNKKSKSPEETASGATIIKSFGIDEKGKQIEEVYLQIKKEIKIKMMPATIDVFEKLIEIDDSENKEENTLKLLLDLGALLYNTITIEKSKELKHERTTIL